ncbi:heavy-metal-associated domain-containing protein, partial [Gammaproteobacteria bacterium]|nr:heavy-metal-associated domain-containing protein [Gammaproteobacteria bacterium]
MKKLINCVFLIMMCITAAAQDHAMHDMEGHSHEGHLHDTMVDGKLLVVNPERFDKFVSTLEG